MRWISDPTRRFARRPVYDRDEIEFECSELLRSEFDKRKIASEPPIPTDLLDSIIEAKTADYDEASDLSWLGGDVEGATQFMLEKKPKVMISRELQNNENRRRMTIAHELAHVHFHAMLYQVDYSYQLFTEMRSSEPVVCRRNTVERLGGDWMEWQAGFAAGALLMPKEWILREVATFGEQRGFKPPLTETDPILHILANHIAQRFHVSFDAARVRLDQLGHVAHEKAQSLRV